MSLIAAPTGSGKTLAAFLAAIDGLVRQGLAGELTRRDAGRLRLAAEGAVERHPAQSRGAARRHPRGAAPRGACPMSRSAPGCAPATRRRASATRMRRAAAAHRRDHAGIALHPARLRIGPRDAGDHAHRDRRRDPRRGAEQARRASRAVARAAGRARAATGCCASACRPRRSRSRRSRASWSAPTPTARAADCRIIDTGHQRAPRPRARGAGLAARSGDVGRGLEAGLRPAGRADRGAPHHAGLRQHAPHGRARRRASSPSASARTDVAAHHGSLAKEQRLDAEQRLKSGELKALVATASLELGIDIGDVDLVCQLGSPRSIATLPAARRPLRPRGRRHAEGPAVSAVARRAGRMRRAARQRRAAASSTGSRCPSSRSTCWRSRSSPKSRRSEWSEDELFALVRRAWPYRDLAREDFDAVVAHAGRGLHHAARPARRADPSRRASTTCCAAGAARG